MRDRSAASCVLLLAAVYPAAVILLLVTLPVVQPRNGPLALAAVLGKPRSPSMEAERECELD